MVSSHFTEQTSTGPQTLRDFPGHGSFLIGGMANHGPRAAFGAALMLGNGSGGERVGVEARARRWLGAGRAIDVSAGPLLASVHAHSLSDRTRSYGVGADASVMWFDWVGLTARGEVVRAEGRNLSALYGGVRLGSYPGVVVTGGFALLAAFVTLVSD